MQADSTNSGASWRWPECHWKPFLVPGSPFTVYSVTRVRVWWHLRLNRISVTLVHCHSRQSLVSGSDSGDNLPRDACLQRVRQSYGTARAGAAPGTDRAPHH